MALPMTSLPFVFCFLVAAQHEDHGEAVALLQIDVRRHKSDWNKTGPPSNEDLPTVNDLFIGTDEIESCGEAGILMDKELCLSGLVIRKTTSGDNRDEYFPGSPQVDNCTYQGPNHGCYIKGDRARFNSDCQTVWVGEKGWHNPYNKLNGVVCGGKGLKPRLTCSSGTMRQRFYIDLTNASCSEGGGPLMNMTMCKTGLNSVIAHFPSQRTTDQTIGGFPGTIEDGIAALGGGMQFTDNAKDLFTPERAKTRHTDSCGIGRPNCAGIEREENPEMWKPGCFIYNEIHRPQIIWNEPGHGTAGVAGYGRQICEVFECFGGGTTATTTTTRPADPCNDNAVLQLKTPLYSNLGGKGPDAGEKGLLFASAGMIKGVSVDVKMVAVGLYEPFNAAVNGVSGSLGVVSLKLGSSATFDFLLLESGTENPVSVDGMSITFLDIDEGKRAKGRATISVCDAAVALPDTTELTLKQDGSCTSISSSKKGTGKDNPTSTAALTDVQKMKIVTVNYGAGSKFRVTLGLAPKGKTGRNFNFAFEPVVDCDKAAP